MGAQPSKPKPGTKFQVIGAGMSRTGTASFSEALHILLDGPVYHGGTQAVLGPEADILRQKAILDKLNNARGAPATAKAETEAPAMLRQLYDGYAAATDVPANYLVPQLLQAFPDAMVICTVRDPEAWAKSIQTISSVTRMWFLRFVLLPLPGVRYFPGFIDATIQRWQSLYGTGTSIEAYHKHIAMLKETVPEDKLVFFSVKDGWEPLCKALGKPVPKIPFPRINDGEAIERLAKQKVTEGLMRWAVIFGAIAVGAGSMWWFRR